MGDLIISMRFIQFVITEFLLRNHNLERKYKFALVKLE